MLRNDKDMTSPITGRRMTLNFEWRDIEYRKETFRVMVPFYRCEDSGEQFTTTESDGVWWHQMQMQYCRKYGIPYTDEIVALRSRYGLSAQKMSLILGFGENQWRKYEQEEIPSVSNGRVILSAMNPNVMMDFVNSARGVLTDKEYEAMRRKVQTVIDQQESRDFEEYEMKRVFAYRRGDENGYAPLSLNRLKNVMLHVLELCGEMWVTKMNKLLFYIDFMSYRERGMAITGLAYRAIDYGPVPERWEKVYSEFDEIGQEPRSMGEYEGQVLVAKTKPEAGVLTEEELTIINAVCEKLKDCSSRMVSDMSHEEKAWIENHEGHRMIPFADAFDLKMM